MNTPGTGHHSSAEERRVQNSHREWRLWGAVSDTCLGRSDVPHCSFRSKCQVKALLHDVIDEETIADNCDKNIVEREIAFGNAVAQIALGAIKSDACLRSPQNKHCVSLCWGPHKMKNVHWWWTLSGNSQMSLREGDEEEGKSRLSKYNLDGRDGG